MSAHARTIKRLHRYNEREEQMRVEMMLRRSWARYRRHVKRGPKALWAATWVKAHAGPRLVRTLPGPGISGAYVWEWPAYPIDKGGGEA